MAADDPLAGYGSLAEATDPYCLAAGEAARLLAGHPWKRFAVIGDSVASGVGDPVPGYVELAWCDRIRFELAAQQPDLVYLNLGVRELRAAEVRATQLDEALRFGPDLALVVAGGNDALRRSYRPDETDAELAAMVTALQEAGADVITVGIFDASYAPSFPVAVKPQVSERMMTLSRRTAALAARLGTLHVDCTGHPAERDPGSYSADGIHGNLRSHGICAALTVRRLGTHLGR
ncbi:SGNH/GDSL hydrolase family protein [Catellatospora sp. KI3]|uniref:SGNH/GDSL hydrolase family protein n=1 Tax=Catellatospora sp. KI3 TaxID=3041620 RepID=UPI00248242A7|nr:SGNH/GDSL hydrolase family protein [Catellatospora sp. KI3]MDI1463953.1 SGNH/GDSL hydrolase family protein [Catellatospora sp. KI3]